MFKLELNKTEARNQVENVYWIIEKAKELKKKICFIDYTKAFDCVYHNKLENT